MKHRTNIFKRLKLVKNHDTDKRLKVDWKGIFWSTVFLLAIGLFLYLLLRENQAKSMPLISSIYKYGSTEWAMVFMIALFVSVGWLLLWFLIFQRFVKEMSFLGLTIAIAHNTPKVLWFIFGLPPGILVGIAVASIIGLVSLPPSCEVPGIIFTVRAGSGEAKEYTPESEAIIERSGSSIVFLKSYPSEEETASINDDMSCQFQALGALVERIDTPFKKSCLTTIYLKKGLPLPDRIVVKADVKGKYCDVSSSYNITILVK